MKEKICIFIDGENLRHSIKGLFPDHYNNTHYYPFADWDLFIKAIVQLTSRKINLNADHAKLIRCYWYVINELFFDKEYTKDYFKSQKVHDKLKYYKRVASSVAKKEILPTDSKIQAILKECEDLLQGNQKSIEKQLESWSQIQSTIQLKYTQIQFQKFGYLKTRLDDGAGKISFDGEKGVDIKLATDLITMNKIYDIAILVSGDADYIPAIHAIKNLGKQVVIVDFKTKHGKFLPGGAVKLREHADFSFSINYETMLGICRYGLGKDDPAVPLDFSKYDF